jgi:hypothetical protein
MRSFKKIHHPRPPIEVAFLCLGIAGNRPPYMKCHPVARIAIINLKEYP